MSGPLEFAALGQLPAGFHRETASLGTWQEINLDDLTRGATRSLRILAVGDYPDLSQLMPLIPTLRMTNPSLLLVRVPVQAASTAVPQAALMDMVLRAETDYRAFAERCLKERRQVGVTGSVRRAAGTVVSSMAPVLLLLLLWEAAVWALQPPPYLLPPPSQVLETFRQQYDRFLMHLAVTALEALAGFLIGNSLGIAVAVLMARFVRLTTFTMPVLVSLQSIPVVAFAPLLGVWLGTGYAAKVGMAALICFFPMVVNTLQAFANVDTDYMELFRIYKANFRTLLCRLLIPASASSVIAALKISAGLAVVGAIVAEMTGADRGLGFLILNGAYRLETDLLFVAMLLSGVLGMTFYVLPEAARPLLPRAWRQGMGKA